MIEAGFDRFDPRGPLTDVFHAEARRQSRSVPARQHRLAVLRIDRVGDEPRLGALQRRGLDPIGDQAARATRSTAASSVSIVTPGLGMA